jgi:hypothetical protein
MTLIRYCRECMISDYMKKATLETRMAVVNAIKVPGDPIVAAPLVVGVVAGSAEGDVVPPSTGWLVGAAVPSTGLAGATVGEVLSPPAGWLVRAAVAGLVVAGVVVVALDGAAVSGLVVAGAVVAQPQASA